MTKHYSSSVAFRFPIAFQIVILLLVVALLPVVVESPRWLALHGRDEEALQVVARLMGVEPTDAGALDRYREIADGVAYERTVAARGWTDLFRNDELSSRRRLLIAVSATYSRRGRH